MAIESYYRALTIQRKVETDNGSGGTIETWSDYLTIQGLVDWVSDKGINSAGQWQTILNPIMMTAAGQDIKQDDRVVDSVDSIIYLIKNIPDNIMFLNHHVEVELEVLTGG
jgi:SPP1 family predicted phage head-tail adaptor